MDVRSLLLSFEGRINRAKYWRGMLLILLAGIVIDLLIGFTGAGAGTFGLVLVVLVTVGLLYLMYAVAAKHFQDRGKPGTTALYGLVPLLLVTILSLLGLTGTPEQPNLLGWIAAAV